MLDTPTRTDRVGLHFLEYYAPHNVFHCGIDYNWGIGNQDEGQPVIPHTWGIVEYAGLVSNGDMNGGLGNYLVLYYPHLNRWARFLHLEKILVKVGDKTPPKQAIALLGHTGTTSAHLHCEVLNQKGRDYIRNWWRPYGHYPSGLSKQAVASMWEDPDAFIRNNNHPVPKTVDERAELEAKLLKAQRAILHASPSRKLSLTRFVARIVEALSKLGQA